YGNIWRFYCTNGFNSHSDKDITSVKSDRALRISQLVDLINNTANNNFKDQMSKTFLITLTKKAGVQINNDEFHFAISTLENEKNYILGNGNNTSALVTDPGTQKILAKSIDGIIYTTKLAASIVSAVP